MLLLLLQEAQLSQRDRATLYLSAFVLLELERFQSAKVTFKGIVTGAI